LQDFKVDLKMLITIITFAATIGGFYYSTQLRLDNLEENYQTIQKQVKIVKRQINKKNK